MAEKLQPQASFDEFRIVFFDGVCGLCNVSVNWLLNHDFQARLKFAPLQGETASQLLPIEATGNLGSVVFWDQGVISRKSTAVVRMLWGLGGVWCFAGWLLWLIPRPIRDVGYWVVASNRYRLFGKKESCRLPRPEEIERFLP